MKRSLFGTVALAAVALTVVLVGAASAKAPAPTGNCPSTLSGWQPSNAVGAHSTGTAPGEVTYYFDSLTNEGAGAGLVGYCVYTNGVLSGTTVTPTGWKTDHNAGNASWVRGNGTKSNIPLDGTTGIKIGTGTFSAPFTTQTILLHIADATECNNIYGGNPGTCYVLPKPGPVCNDGSGVTGVGYNSMPFDVQHCSPPSYAFEGNFANEFGDGVTLDTSGGSHIQSMTVDFQSYGCSDSGRWYTADCMTTPGKTFTIPDGITANIYNPNGAGGLTTPIATATIPEGSLAIPFRPSANVLDTNCPNPPGDPGALPNSRFKDPVSGQCNYSLSVPLTFTFAGEALPSTVVWTVQFNTTHSGYKPIGEAATCVNGGNAPGCGYDSLNVGTKSYDNAPYAGGDVDVNTVYISNGNSVWSAPFVSLAPITSFPDWGGYRPLAEIDLGT
jgi:hypothetical protein